MYNQECASLILNTCDLPLNASNNIGTLDQYITNATWNNINMRTLLGSMYDKYDRFALVPVKYQNIEPPNAFTQFYVIGNVPTLDSLNDLSLTLNIQGLPFTNNNYNTNTKTNTSYSIFNTIFLDNTRVSSFTGGSTLTFTKNQELVNLNIFYKRLSGTNFAPTVVFPNFMVMFNIYGIDKHDRLKDLNSSRIF